jgi:NAD(P)-dependent dehydrogenase (short-subunit alcohol dehydrogenase family)
MKRLTGKVALITSDEQGLAAAVALAFGREGATVAISGTDAQRLEADAGAVRETGAECLALILDPTHPGSCERGVAQVVKAFGRLDVVCNLAGDYPLTGPLHEIEEEEYDRAVAANITSVLLVSRYAVPAIRASDGPGSIVNLSHSAALNGVPGTSLLAATKGALLNMTRSMAIQGEEEGFRVNCVCLGSTYVPVVPSMMDEQRQHPAPPEEWVGAFVFLASEESAHISGHILAADDGMHAWRTGL